LNKSSQTFEGGCSIREGECSTIGHAPDDDGTWRFSSYYDPHFVSVMNQELTRLTQLKRNWDGYNAQPLKEDLIDAARSLVDLLEGVACRPKVVPLSEGGVQFEWHNGPQTLEFGIEDAGDVNYLKYDPRHGIEEDGAVSLDDCDSLRALVAWFMKGLGECQAPTQLGRK
jgi:hypothetical protein